MFPLGHVGIGTHLVPPRTRAQLGWRWLAFGCLLPDLIDKPLYLAARLLPRAGLDQLHLLRGSRLFGHTLFFLALLVAAALLLRSGRLVAVAWGLSTHLLLDLVPDVASGAFFQWRTWLFWPLFGWGFPPAYAGNVGLEYAAYIVGDLVGIGLLIRDYLRSPTFR